MNHFHSKFALSLLLVALATAACNGGATPTTSAPPVVVDSLAVVADGRLLPRRSVLLSFTVGGKVAELLVAEGEPVAEGEVIARLENSAALQAQVAQTEQEALNAQQALTDLRHHAASAAAQAQLAVAQAQDRLTEANRHLYNVQHPDLKWYQDRVDDAQHALTIAQQNSQLVDLSGPTAALKNAQDALTDAEKNLADVQTLEDRYPRGFTDQLKDAQKAYDKALDNFHAAQVALAQAQLSNSDAVKNAQKALDDAREDLDRAQATPDSTDLALAEADAALARAALAEAQAHADKVKDGPDPDQLASAEARLKTARASLAAAQAALADIELRAPIAGTLADLNLKIGEQAVPGQPAATVADFSGWKVETDNLTEIEVVRLSEGQDATVVLDALPHQPLHGKVQSISSVFEEKRGDITYTVVVILSDEQPQMRWGMTAEVTFGN
jgi:multidrug efflux pump subunit AcrA (membrane-fusion protein)